MNQTISSIAILVVVLVIHAPGQPSKPVPVYPGATLITEHEEGAEPGCCDFVTNDALDKVVAFYEKQLKTKGLDATALVAKYPVIKQQVEAIAQQMPPGAALRAFVLDEVKTGSQTAPILFEVVGSPQGVYFSIGGDALTGNDAMFAKQWREKTGKLTEEETMQKESDQRQADEDKDQKERDARRAKEEPECRSKMVNELTKVLKQSKLDLSPGLQCEIVRRQEGETSVSFAFWFASPDEFKKVTDFYSAHARASSIDNLKGGESRWRDDEPVFLWRMATFELGKNLELEVRELSLAKQGPKKSYVIIEVSSPDVVNSLRGIQQEYESRW